MTFVIDHEFNGISLNYTNKKDQVKRTLKIEGSKFEHFNNSMMKLN